MTYFQKVLEEMHIRQFMKRKSISDSRSVESILDKRLRIEVQPTQTNEVERVKRFMNVHLHCIRGRIQGGAIGESRSPHLKPTKVTSFTIILNNSENSISDIRPFCHPFFVTAVLSSMLHLSYNSEPVSHFAIHFLSQQCCQACCISLTIVNP